MRIYYNKSIVELSVITKVAYSLIIVIALSVYLFSTISPIFLEKNLDHIIHLLIKGKEWAEGRRKASLAHFLITLATTPQSSPPNLHNVE
jgi:hypothetical protein